MDVTIAILVALVIVVALIMFSGVPELLIVSRIIKSMLKSSDIDSKADKTEVTMQKIDKMSGKEFEKLCANMLNKNGFTEMEFTPGSGDQGVDIIATKDGKKYAIQCKRYNQKLGNKPVQEVYAGKTIYGCSVAVVLTNNYFTDGAKEAARATGVELWDRDTLRRMLVYAEHREGASQ